MTDDETPFIQAGKYSLRVLEGDELAQAQRAILTDQSFAQAVEWWDRRLGTMAEEAARFTPSSSVRDAIMSRIRQDHASDRDVISLQPKAAPPSGWSVGFAMFGTAMAAAALVLYLATPVGTVPDRSGSTIAAGSQLVAQLRSDDGSARLAGIVDPGSGRLIIRASGLDAQPGQAAELWVIPADGTPRSLGFIPASGLLERSLADAERALLVEGSNLAVTFEQDTGVRHEAPSSPILLAGPIDSV